MQTAHVSYPTGNKDFSVLEAFPAAGAPAVTAWVLGCRSLLLRVDAAAAAAAGGASGGDGDGDGDDLPG